MTLDGFLGFLGLFAAFYALIPPVARLRLQLHLPFQLPLALLALSAVLYLEFFSIVGQPCMLPDEIVCAWITFPHDQSFTPQQAAFLVVLAWLTMAVCLNSLKYRRRHLETIAKIVQTLLFERRFADLVDFNEPIIGLINQSAEGQNFMQRVRRWFAAEHLVHEEMHREVLQALGEAPQQEGTWRRIGNGCRKGLRWIRHAFPAESKAQSSADKILRLMFRSEEFRHYLVNTRIDAAVGLMRSRHQQRFEFADAMLADLISTPKSPIYLETRHTEHLSAEGNYFIPSDNVLLQYLLGDADVARRHLAWKPVGDHIINTIRRSGKSGYADILNSRQDDFDEMQYDDPTFVALRFFDIMVRAATIQGVEDHMWLHYLPLIVDELIKVHDASDPSVIETDEFPTKGTRLIYEALSLLGNWVQLISKVPADSPHAAISENSANIGAAIPANAAVAMGHVLASIALSPRLNVTFASYMHDCALRDVRSLPKEGREGAMRQFLIRQIVFGGWKKPGTKYGTALKALVEETDHVLLGDVDDYAELLRKTYP